MKLALFLLTLLASAASASPYAYLPVAIDPYGYPADFYPYYADRMTRFDDRVFDVGPPRITRSPGGREIGPDLDYDVTQRATWEAECADQKAIGMREFRECFQAKRRAMLEARDRSFDEVQKRHHQRG